MPGTCRSPNAPDGGHSPGGAAPCEDGVEEEEDASGIEEEEEASVKVTAQVSLRRGYLPVCMKIVFTTL